MIYYPMAKINLTLAITGRRQDGYHTLDTVFQPVSLCDVLEAQRCADGLHFSCSVPELETEDNLVIRAFRLMQQRFGFDGGLAVRLEKHIPSQAGLGGGSGDAAMMLKAVNEQFSLGLTPEMLAELGAELGADVPAMIYPRAVRGRGTGTKLSHFPAKGSLPLIIIKPELALSTPVMYRRFDVEGVFSEDTAGDAMEKALCRGDGKAIAAGLKNDFETILHEPQIDAAKAALASSGAAGTLLSGSGSAVFGIYPDPLTRDRAFAALKEGFRVFSCETVNRGDDR